MKNIKALSGVILIFILGAASGVLGTKYFYKSRIEALICGESRTYVESIIKRLSSDLDLGSQQISQAKIILQETSSEIKLVRRQFHPQMEAIMEKGFERIRIILRPEQREKFDKIILLREVGLQKK